MPFEKGKSGNENGRPKGAVSTTTKETRELLKKALEPHLGNVSEALDRILEDDPAKYVDALSKLLPYFIPKQTEIDMNFANELKIYVKRFVRTDSK